MWNAYLTASLKKCLSEATFFMHTLFKATFGASCGRLAQLAEAERMRACALWLIRCPLILFHRNVWKYRIGFNPYSFYR